MATDIILPALSPAMEKGNLSRWVKSVGDTVSIGEVIAEVETDKAAVDIEATADGVLSSIIIGEGTADVPVNTVIGVIRAKGEEATTSPAATHQEVAEAKPVAPVNGHAPVQDGEEMNGRVRISPIAKRLMREAGLALSEIAATGPKGRILERDVKTALNARNQAPSLPVQPAAPAATVNFATPTAIFNATPTSASLPFLEGSYDLVPHDAMRLAIANRLTESKQTIPHFYVTVRCQMDALLALRATLNASAVEGDGEPDYRLSVNDLIVKALAMSLRRVPDANVSFTKDGMLRHHHSDIAVAVALDGGLITPIVRQAETKSISAISNELQDLIARARKRKLKPDEFQGGTAGISNLGMYGVSEFAAIINPPQATNLAVGAVEERVAMKDGVATGIQMMTVTISADHRAVDGATAAELLREFRKLIENPMRLLS